MYRCQNMGKNYFRFKLAAEFEGKLCGEFLKTHSFLLELYVHHFSARSS